MHPGFLLPAALDAANQEHPRHARRRRRAASARSAGWMSRLRASIAGWTRRGPTAPTMGVESRDPIEAK